MHIYIYICVHTYIHAYIHTYMSILHTYACNDNNDNNSNSKKKRRPTQGISRAILAYRYCYR